MKALVYTGVEEMEFREEKEPSEKPGESILKVHASGICGSCLLYTSPSPRDRQKSRMPSSA